VCHVPMLKSKSCAPSRGVAGVVCAKRGCAQSQSMKAGLRESAIAKIVRRERVVEPCVTMMRGSVG
jgi:hypothetical protein